MKRILIPASRPINPFFDEIERNSSVRFIFGNLSSDIGDIDGVLFQWPEQLFDWKEPSETDIQTLKAFIERSRRKRIPIYYLVHNQGPHRGWTLGFRILYDLVLDAAQVMIHMGGFSRTMFLESYKNAKHVVIPHPLYESSYERKDKDEARRTLGISPSAKVIFCHGEVRSAEERAWLLKAFDRLQVSDKVLLLPRMFKFKSRIEFKGRIRLRKVFDVRVLHEKWLNSYNGTGTIIQHDKKFKDTDLYSEMIGAADIFFIARKKLLNSGGVLLGLGMQKVVVGPGVGNVTAVLEDFDFPSFDPSRIEEVTKALKTGLEMSFPLGHVNLMKYRPANVGRQYSELFNESIDLLKAR